MTAYDSNKVLVNVGRHIILNENHYQHYLYLL